VSFSKLPDSSSLVQPKLTKTITEKACGNEPEVTFDCFKAINSSVIVKSRLCKNLKFWQDIGANQWILDIISTGYYLPVVALPQPKLFNNHGKSEFVFNEIKKNYFYGSTS
jgi:hypothetical protein